MQIRDNVKISPLATLSLSLLPPPPLFKLTLTVALNVALQEEGGQRQQQQHRVQRVQREQQHKRRRRRHRGPFICV
jgi:hypothetical protein